MSIVYSRKLIVSASPGEGAAALAGELAEQQRLMFEGAGRAAAKPLLEALLHYSFDQSEEGIVASEGIKAYLQVCPVPAKPDSEAITST